MASLRVFVSSTCFDLGPIRGQLRNFLSQLGFDPIMSDYNDVLYDPRIHTHTSCIEEIGSCDIVVLLVGSRFGGKAIPEAISKIDFENIIEKSKSVEHIKKKENISITQLEVLKAVELEIPIFTFIDNKLWNDHELFEKNKAKPIIKDIEFPSIERRETAEFIFEFINFLRHRIKGNSINTFMKFEDIENTLKKQWAGLFQRLLSESRNKLLEFKRIDILSSQFEDLKTAILTSITNSNEREVARGVVRFRKLIDFLRALSLHDNSSFLKSNITWDDFIHKVVDIKEVVGLDNFTIVTNRPLRFKTLMIKNDNTFYEVRFGSEYLDEISQQFEAFVSLTTETKNIIFEALSDMKTSFMIIKYHKEDYREYLDEFHREYLIHRQLFDEQDETLDHKNL